MPRATLGMFALLLAGAVMSAATTAGEPIASVPSTPPPFIPVFLDRLPLPAGLMPDQPVFSADGRWILFLDRLGGGLWSLGADGGSPRCLTCALPERPAAGGIQPFADGWRALLTGADPAVSAGDGAWVLECAPTLADCTEARILPVDFTAAASAELLARRDWRLAPDDRHLAWSDLRRDGTALVLAQLERLSDRYVLVAPRVINPPGPTGPAETDADRWENLWQSWRLAAFADGGAAVLVSGARGGNPDLWKLELANGATTRLTGHPDWDAAGALSPDGTLLALASWRTRDRLLATGWLPGLRNFIGLPLGEALEALYRSTWEALQCDLSPWLLPADGDRDGQWLGQPLTVYDDRQTPADNRAGQAVWSPDGTRVLLASASPAPVPPGLPVAVARRGLAASQVLLARLERAPVAPLPVVSSAPGPWAPALADWRGPLAGTGSVTIPGRQHGTATLDRQGDLLTGRVTVTFTDYSDNGVSVVNGTMTAEMADGDLRVQLDLTTKGATSDGAGALTADYRIDRDLDGRPTAGGSWVASRDGHPAPPLPAPTACPDRLPRPAPLAVNIRRDPAADVISVRATIGEDQRPVQNALVIGPGGPWRTDAQGEVRLPPTPPGSRTVTVLAGDTFLPAAVTQ